MSSKAWVFRFRVLGFLCYNPRFPSSTLFKGFLEGLLKGFLKGLLKRIFML